MNPDILFAAAAQYTTPLAIVDETVMLANITAMQTLAASRSTGINGCNAS